MNNEIVLLEKDYSSEELCDVERDVSECFDPSFNPDAEGIPIDEYGFSPGVYRVRVEWIPEE